MEHPCARRVSYLHQQADRSSHRYTYVLMHLGISCLYLRAKKVAFCKGRYPWTDRRKREEGGGGSSAFWFVFLCTYSVHYRFLASQECRWWCEWRTERRHFLSSVHADFLLLIFPFVFLPSFSHIHWDGPTATGYATRRLAAYSKERSGSS